MLKEYEFTSCSVVYIVDLHRLKSLIDYLPPRGSIDLCYFLFIQICVMFMHWPARFPVKIDDGWACFLCQG